MRILKYEILARHGVNSVSELIEVVNEYMDRGWQPLGGIAIAESNYGLRATQAIGYYEEAMDVVTECKHEWGLKHALDSKISWDECLKCGKQEHFSKIIKTTCTHRLAVGVNRHCQLVYFDNPSVVNDSLIPRNDIFTFCPDCGKCLIDVYGNRE